MSEYFVVLKTGMAPWLSSQEIALVYIMASQSESFKFHAYWLGQQVGLSKNTVLKCLTSLKDKGVVSIVHEREGGKFSGRHFILHRDKVVPPLNKKAKPNVYNEEDDNLPF